MFDKFDDFDFHICYFVDYPLKSGMVRMKVQDGISFLVGSVYTKDDPQKDVFTKRMQNNTVNPVLFARILFSRNYARVPHRENKFHAKYCNYTQAYT